VDIRRKVGGEVIFFTIEAAARRGAGPVRSAADGPEPPAAAPRPTPYPRSRHVFAWRVELSRAVPMRMSSEGKLLTAGRARPALAGVARIVVSLVGKRVALDSLPRTLRVSWVRACNSLDRPAAALPAQLTGTALAHCRVTSFIP